MNNFLFKFVSMHNFLFRFTAELLQANTERKNAIYGGYNPNVNNVMFRIQ